MDVLHCSRLPSLAGQAAHCRVGCLIGFAYRSFTPERLCARLIMQTAVMLPANFTFIASSPAAAAAVLVDPSRIHVQDSYIHGRPKFMQLARTSARSPVVRRACEAIRRKKRAPRKTSPLLVLIVRLEGHTRTQASRVDRTDVMTRWPVALLQSMQGSTKEDAK